MHSLTLCVKPLYTWEAIKRCISSRPVKKLFKSEVVILVRKVLSSKFEKVIDDVVGVFNEYDIDGQKMAGYLEDDFDDDPFASKDKALNDEFKDAIACTRQCINRIKKLGTYPKVHSHRNLKSTSLAHLFKDTYIYAHVHMSHANTHFHIPEELRKVRYSWRCPFSQAPAIHFVSHIFEDACINTHMQTRANTLAYIHIPEQL